MKKFMSIMLTMGLMASSMNMVSAATATDDIQDKHVKEAVDRLMAFGIVNGMEDGKYHPEMKVTREQFAKIMVEALGLADAAKATQSAPLFTDIESSRWSAGYISVAIGEGILKGYPDGTFRPTKEVSYAEAVTMLVRGLGYKDEFLSGAAWPHNYIAKAASEGVTSHVDFDTTGTADRGSVAVMVNNTLDADTISASEYANATFGNTTYSKSGKTLLEDKLEITKVEDATITGTPKVDKDVDEDQIEFRADDDYDSLDIKEDKEVIFDVKEGIELNSYLGETVNVYINDDEEVVYFEETSRDTDAFYGVVDVESSAIEAITKDDEKVEKALDEELTIIDAEGDDKDYDLADEDELKVYVDNKEVDFDDFAEMVKESGNTVFAKFIKDKKGKIATIDAQIFEELAAIAVKADDDRLTYRDATADSKDDEEKLKFGKDEDIEKIIVMDVNGKQMSVDDIKENDVLYINKNLSELDNGKIDSDDDLEEQSSKDVIAYVVVVRNTVEGALKTFDQEDGEVKIGSKQYDVDTKYGTVTANENEDIYEFTDDNDGKDALEALSDVDDEVEAYKGISGDLVHIQGKAESSSSEKYAIITDINTSKKNAKIDILTAEEKISSDMALDFDEDEFLGYDDEDDFKSDDVIGDVIKYTVNSDNEIDHIEKIAELNSSLELKVANTKFEDDFEVKMGKLTDDFKSDELEIDNDDLSVDSKVVVFKYDEIDSLKDVEDIETQKYEKLDGKGEDENVVVFYNDDEEVELILLTSDVSSDDEAAGYIVDANQKSDESVADIHKFGEDKKDEDQVVDELNGSSADEDDYKDIKERVVIYTENSDGELEIFTTQEEYEKEFSDRDFEFVTGKVIEDSSSSIKIETADGDKETITLNSSTLVYETDDKEDRSDIDKDDIVTVLKEGKKARIVKIYDMDEDLDQEIAAENGWDEKDFDDLKDDAEDLIEDYEDMDEDDYTADSWKDLKDAIEDMKEAIDDKDEDDLRKAIADVKEAKEDLKKESGGGSDADVDASFEVSALNPNLGNYSVEIDNVTADEYTVTYQLSDGTEKTTKKADIDAKSVLAGKDNDGDVTVTLYNDGDKVGEYEVSL